MNTEDLCNALSWHLIHTHPRQETRAETNLRSLNIETYVPMYKKVRFNQITGKSACEYRALFPRYVFARFKINDMYHKVRFTRGVQDLVRFDARPAIVDEEIIDLIRSRQETESVIKIEEFHAGERVVIRNGPFERLAAVFQRQTSDAARVVLLLDSVSYGAHVIVDRDSIVKAKDYNDEISYQ